MAEYKNDYIYDGPLHMIPRGHTDVRDDATDHDILFSDPQSQQETNEDTRVDTIDMESCTVTMITDENKGIDVPKGAGHVLSESSCDGLRYDVEPKQEEPAAQQDDRVEQAESVKTEEAAKQEEADDAAKQNEPMEPKAPEKLTIKPKDIVPPRVRMQQMVRRREEEEQKEIERLAAELHAANGTDMPL